MFIQGQWKTKYMAVENVEWLFLPFKTQRVCFSSKQYSLSTVFNAYACKINFFFFLEVVRLYGQRTN